MTDYSGLSLDQVKSMARRVETQPLGAMSELFDEAEAYLAQTQTQIYQLIDSVLQSWQGEASGAAGSHLQQSAAQFDQTRGVTAVASSSSRGFATDLETIKAKIAAIPKVHTSLFSAITSGGLLGLPLGPVGLVGGAAAAYFSHQKQAEANRRKAVALLTEADTKGQQADVDFTNGPASFPMAPGWDGPEPAYPLTLPPSGGSSGGGGAGWGGSGGGGTGAAAGGGPASGVALGPVSGTGRVGATPTTSTAAGPVITSGSGTSRTPVTPTPITSTGGDGSTVPAGFQPAPPADSTIAQGATPGLPGTTGSGTGGSGVSTGIGGGGSAVAGSTLAGGMTTGVAGGVAGLGGQFGGGARAGGDGGLGRSGSRITGSRTGGSAEDEAVRRSPLRRPSLAGDESFERGSGVGGSRATTGSADGAPGRAGGTGTGSLGGAPGDHELAPSRYSAAASELAAGEGRGVMPMGGGAGRRGEDEVELDQRPDYLVESDDVWGDGRLAAPAVLGE